MNDAQCCVQAACSAADLSLTQTIAADVCGFVNIPIKKPTNCVASPTTLSGYSYQGCWTVGKYNNALEGDCYMGYDLSLEICIGMCKGFGDGYLYDGVRNGKECFCANHTPYDGSIKVDDSSCKIPCSESKTEVCGGHKGLLGCGKDSRVVLGNIIWRSKNQCAFLVRKEKSALIKIYVPIFFNMRLTRK